MAQSTSAVQLRIEDGGHPHDLTAFDTSGATVQIMMVTPKMAGEWLLDMINNRPISDTHVAKLSREHEAGNFLLSPDAIAFDQDGHLMNGQHRCRMAVNTGKSFQAIVVRGLDRRVMLVTDTGRKRNLKDQLNLTGENNAHHLSGALNHLYRVQCGVLRNDRTPTVIEGLNLLAEHPGIRSSVALAVKAFRNMPTSVGASLHYVMSQRDAALADYILTNLATGAGLEARDPVWILYCELLRLHREQLRIRTILSHAMMVKCWNALRANKSNPVIRWKPETNEPFPEIQ